ncbi:MAG: ATP-dependent helicase C-terminal domain-containing protein [Actinomycetaceae bacterium]|nr:ATP-dependent helicase C-terminal domain-containing protein [Actinomycetaceae bacterium]
MDTIGRALAACEFPVAGAREQLRRVLDSGERFVLSATPGSGKTTLVPLMIRQWLAEVGDDRRVLIAQPRRVAVRSAARYVASLLGEEPGATVGWTMRGERAMSERTRIEFTTTGTLLRRLLHQPDLDDVGALVIDEVHERHLDADLALAFGLDVADLRGDLALGVMSATAQTDVFLSLLHGSVIAVEAEKYPLQVRWVPPRESGLGPRGATAAFLSHVTETASRAFEQHGSTLVFVPSIRDVTTVVTALSGADRAVYPLHGGLTSAQQDAALADSGPRIVVATDIAETSVTVPGVNCVVDSGLARIPRFDAGRDAQELVTIMASQSSVIQRAGRANRTGPGVVFRCFSETDYARMREFPVPEIESSDLVEGSLMAAAWSSPGELRLPSPFPTPRLTHAISVLDSIEALAGVRERKRMGEPSGQEGEHDQKSMTEPSAVKSEPSSGMSEPSDPHGVTASESGAILALIPADPRLSHALLLASAWSKARDASRIVAHLASTDRQSQPDITLALAAVPEREVRRFESLAKTHERAYAQKYPHPDLTLRRHDLPGVTIGLAFPERIARSRGRVRSDRRTISFISAGGTGFEVDASSPLASDEWIAVSEIQTINGITYVRQGAPLNPDWVPFIVGSLMTESTEVTIENGRLRGIRTTAVGAIPVKKEPSQVEAAEAVEVIRQGVLRSGLDLFSPSNNARQLEQMINYIADQRSDWPRLTHAYLADHVEELVGGTLGQICMGEPLTKVDVTTGLKTMIGWDKAAQLNDLVPESIELPTGRRARLTLDPDRGPTVRVKLQECFGWSAIPKVLGKLITFELLSPAGRPLAITSDLEHFFNNSYRDVRADMRGRYPKHPWPEDPWAAKPTARTKRYE